MQYNVKIGERVYPVEAEPLSDTGSTTVIMDGERMIIGVRVVSPHQFHAEMDGCAMNLFAVRDLDGVWIWVDGRPRFVRDADEVPRRRASAALGRPREVTPPTPAAVVKVLVEVGETVAEGQPLVVVSAMKMEITLTAPYPGRVRSVDAAVGDQVSPGQILVDIEPDAEEDHDE
jgi:acetyl/propionyl-CoA carboxylase alpha subunit